MTSLVALCAVLGGAAARPEPAERLGEWSGRWVVLGAGTSSGRK